MVGFVPFVLGMLMNVYYLVGKRRTRDQPRDWPPLYEATFVPDCD